MVVETSRAVQTSFSPPPVVSLRLDVRYDAVAHQVAVGGLATATGTGDVIGVWSRPFSPARDAEDAARQAQACVLDWLRLVADPDPF